MATTRKQLQNIATALHTGFLPLTAINSAIHDASPKWRKALGNVGELLTESVLYRPNLKPKNTIFTKGNSKLPFLSFSALPGEGHCPGAGECLSFCYSFKAWRYPDAFARQAQNSILLQTQAGRELILADLDKKTHNRKGKPIETTLRLYVDGDFSSLGVAMWWADVLRERPHIKAYGYSKSFSILNSPFINMPENYVLNISSGHNADAATVAEIEKRPFVRGHFVAVDHADKNTYKEATGKNAFVCPGKCGSCLPSGIHACGQKQIRKDIIISTH